MLGQRTDAGRLVFAGQLAIAVVLASVWSAAAQDGTALYTVNLTESPPIIDGMESSPEEWAGASAEGGGDWTKLTADTPDQTANNFVALWDSQGIYFRHQVDYAGWQNRGRNAYDAFYDSLNLYFDPNVDGEANGVPANETDGYRLAFNQPLGASEISDEAQTAGVFVEAYVDTTLGGNINQFSSFAGLQMSQSTSVDNSFGYTEVFIPWIDFDAAEDHPTDTGLYHPEPPTDGEQWYFNMARIQGNFDVPVWSSPSGANFLYQRPHGILEFVGDGGGNNGGSCDLDGDTDCDAEDIDVLTRAVLEGSTEERFDFNDDGKVSEADRIHFVEVTLNTYLGDSNMDGQFSTRDFVHVLTAGGYEDGIPGNATFATGDWNGDFDFDSSDFVIVFSRGGYEQGPRDPVAAVAAVPEPSGCLLWLLGTSGLILLRWRGSRNG